MTTRIATIYDAVVDLIESKLTTYTRIPNPYAIAENTYLHLKQGFAVAIGAGVDTQRYVGCLVTWERLFTIILVKQILTTANNTGVRETIEKSILDDHDALRKAFYLGSTLSGYAIKSTVLDDGGLFYVDGGVNKFIGMELNLYVEYQEDPNT